MLAFIKDNKLVVNTQIHPEEKEDLLKFINDVLEKGAIPEQLYDIEGNVSGIEFKINEN